MVDALVAIADVESPSLDVPALTRCARAIAAWMEHRLHVAPRWMRTDDEQHPHLLFQFGERTDLLLMGHFDTVHPLGTVAKFGIEVRDGKLFGPGVLDMKGGIVVIVEALAYLLETNGTIGNVTVLLNSDEELGSHSSRDLIKSLASEARMVWCFENGEAGGKIRVGRRGAGTVTATVHGKGGHSAYPEKLVNPVDLLAEVLLKIRELSDPASGLVLTPTMVRGSTAFNVVFDEASVSLSIRCSDNGRMADAVEGLRNLALPDGARVEVDYELLMPGWPPQPHGEPFRLAKEAADFLGLEPLVPVEGYGASDANYAASTGAPALDSLGPLGEYHHEAGREYVEIASLSDRAALLSVMVTRALQSFAHKAVA